MWMAYVQSIEIFDFKSTTDNLNQQFTNLAFDAYHEAVYVMGKFLPVD